MILIFRRILIRRYKKYCKEYFNLQNAYVNYQIGDNEYIAKNSKLFHRMEELEDILKMLKWRNKNETLFN